MILYLDTSALIKRSIVEMGFKVIVLVEQAITVGSATLTRIEMASALAKAVRLNWVENKAAQSA